MINPNEVRINNWVLFEGKPYQIDTISKAMPTLNTIEFGVGVVTWDKLEPIKPTESNLKKFGFKSYGDGWLTLGRICLFNIDKNNAVIRIHPSKDTIQMKIKSLHHLQNTIYTLTGQELQVKL